MRKIRYRVFAVVAAWIVTATSSLSHAQVKASDELLKRVLKSYEARDEKLKPIFVRYHVTRSETAAWIAATDPAKKEAHRSGLTIRREAEYARKDNKVRSFARLLETPPGPPEFPEWLREAFWIDSGGQSIRKSGRVNEYIISKRTPARWPAPIPTSLTHEDDLLRTLQRWAAGKKPMSAKATERVEGDRKIVDIVFFFPETKWSNKVRLLAAKDYSIERFEIRNGNGGPVETVEVAADTVVEGLVYPRVATVQHFMAGSQLGFTLALDVESVETNVRKVPDSLFTFKIPTGATLFDEDLQTYVRQQELYESQLDEVVRRLAPQPPPLWQRWWVICSATVGLLLIALFFQARAKRNQAATPVLPRKDPPHASVK